MKKHYYTIGEVCNLLDLKPYIIRYWESEFPILKPLNKKGKVRRYTAEKIELLSKIRNMLYVQKFTIQGVKKKLSQMKSEEKYRKPLQKELINPELKETIVKELTDIQSSLEQALKDK